MRRKMDEGDIAEIAGRQASSAFQIKKLREVSAENPFALYQICLGPHAFAHLYLDAGGYSIVWNESREFDPADPFMLVDLQFSNIPVGELEMIRNVLPKRKRDLLHYYYDRCVAVLVTKEDEAHEFDLLNQEHQDRYVSNFVNDPERLASASFVRYDSTIVTRGGDSTIVTRGGNNFFLGFTAECLQRGDEALSEFTLRVPRTLLLKQRVLTWMTRDLITNKKVRSVNLRDSLTDLHRLVGV